MTAETFSASVRPASTFAPQKHLGGSYKLTSAAVTALGAVTTSSTVEDVLQVLSTVTAAQHEVGSNSIGFATSVQN